jgi:hypothetical protein
MSADPSSSPAPRASDADRDQVIGLLRAAVTDGHLELVLAPGMAVDANEPRVRHGQLAISRDAGDGTPQTLSVHLAGRMKHGGISTRWVPPGP